MRNPDFLVNIATSLSFLWKALPKNRSSSFGNTIRQLEKMAAGKQLSEAERYYVWAGFSREDEVGKLLSADSISKTQSAESIERKRWLTRFIKPKGDFNHVLRTDLDLVLPNDMLFKTDMMSMANSFVRSKFN